MKTENDLNQDILKITMKIRTEFPELSKYINEMPVKEIDTTDQGINIKNLQDYYNSLEELLQKFSEEHNKSENKTN